MATFIRVEVVVERDAYLSSRGLWFHPGWIEADGAMAWKLRPIQSMHVEQGK